MLELVIGGSCSGKSAYAEKLLFDNKDLDFKYYIAAMQPFDEESCARVERHRQSRDGKGFVTIEQYQNVGLALNCMESGKDKKMTEIKCGALLECVSNLTANEMFGGAAPLASQETADKVCSDILSLGENLEMLVVVSNNVFEDGVSYDETTTAYLEAMGRINARLAAAADAVTEVVAGIPVAVKAASNSAEQCGMETDI
jgi:adenosylcobinamide kinase/adenosylcobinamide-phosphate guanylyltransferase